MEILFANSKLERDCCESARRNRRFGQKQATLVQRRLDEMYAAATLAELRTLPQVRCHELTGDRKGQLSVDLLHPYRLLFRVEGERPRKPDGGLDWQKVTAVHVVGIENTHD